MIRHALHQRGLSRTDFYESGVDSHRHNGNRHEIRTIHFYQSQNHHGHLHMLLLTRRQGENILIGNEILIHVLSVSEADGDVHLQIEAPDLFAVQCVDVESDVSARKANPVITHKRRWRSLVTK